MNKNGFLKACEFKKGKRLCTLVGKATERL
jgi:hypothetical protein